VTWEFAIKDIQLNGPIDDQSILFGPGGVNGMYNNPDVAEAPVPGHLEKATQIRDELSMLVKAISQWARQNHKKKGDQADSSDLLAYVEKGTPLYLALEDPTGPKDILGNPFGPFVAYDFPKVNPATFKALSDSASYNFWLPYIGR
jgi:hypothetical protein